MAVRTDKLYDHHLDVTQHEVRNFVLENLAAAPASPVRGQTYFDTTLLRTRVWDGTRWLSLMATPRPCFKVDRNSVAQAAVNTNTLQKINYNNVQFDATGSFNTGTSSFTAPVAGVYQFTHSVYNTTLNATNNGHISACINLNGSQVYRGGTALINGVVPVPGLATTLLNLAVNDVVDFFWVHNGVAGSFAYTPTPNQTWAAGYLLT